MVSWRSQLTRRSLVSGVIVMTVGFTGCLSGESDSSEEKKDIVDSYTAAGKQYEDALEYFNDGSDEWERENLSEAANQFNEAIPRFEMAVEDFREVEDRCIAIGESDAAEICSESAEVCRHLEDASLYIKRAAEAYQEGDEEKGKDNFNRYIEQHEKARQRRIRDPDVLANALGLETE